MQPNLLKWMGRSAWRLSIAGALVAVTGQVVSSRIIHRPSVNHPVLGRVHRPGVECRWRLEGNGTGVWTSNDVRRTSLSNPFGTSPLLILGDSFTEGAQVSDDQHFAHLLERNMCASGLRRAVFALGRSGYSVADYVANAGSFRRMFGPHWVVIQVSEDDFTTDAWSAVKGASVARFEEVAGGEKVGIVPSHYRAGSIEMLLDKFHLRVDLVDYLLRRRQFFLEWLADSAQPWFRATRKSQVPPDVRRYPIETEMRMLAEAYEKKVTLLYLPPFDPHHPGEKTKAEVALRTSAERQGIRFVSLSERFPELAACGLAPYGFGNSVFNQGHWNKYGHQVAAELLFNDFLRLADDLQ